MWSSGADLSLECRERVTKQRVIDLDNVLELIGMLRQINHLSLTTGGAPLSAALSQVSLAQSLGKI